jgi:hypothetical protein
VCIKPAVRIEGGHDLIAVAGAALRVVVIPSKVE